MQQQERAALFSQALRTLEKQFPECSQHVSISWLDEQRPLFTASRPDAQLSLHAHELHGLPTGTSALCSNGCCLGFKRQDGTLLVLHASAPFSPEICAPKLLLYALDREMACREQGLALQEQIDFGKKVVHSMASGFLVLLPDLTVQDANPAACELLQVPQETLVGTRLSEVIFSELQVKQVFKTGKPITDKELFIKLKNKVLHILKTAVPVLDKHGNIIAVLDHFREIREAHRLVSQMTGAKASFTFDDIIHTSQSMADVIELGRVAAGSALSVLISGESGTGKELFAHAVHMASERRNAPFVVIDCASMPRELVASELFGYMEGAFTGARRGGMPGKFELANGGTVFLDELGELPLEVQAQFLRVLQTHQVTRLAGKNVLPVDVRIIAATNRDLEQEVRQGSFREDLFYRLNVMAIHIPPLRSRPEDIPSLVRYFTNKYCDMVGKSRVQFSPEAQQWLLNYSWPGNVRELENVIARSVHICTDHIELAHVLPPRRAQAASRIVPPPVERNGTFKDMEASALQEALLSCEGNISQVARILGIARSTVYKKIEACRRRGISIHIP